jgi:hypothetical protein
VHVGCSKKSFWLSFLCSGVPVSNLCRNTILRFLHSFLQTVYAEAGIYTGLFIMYSGIAKIYYRKTVGHVFTYFFLWGCVKDRVFTPLLPRDLADLKARTIAAVKNIDATMLTRV